MNTIQAANVEYKYTKTRIGLQHGYKVFVEGELIGQVIQDWKKVWGGDCWTIKREGEETVTLKTRKEASTFLRQISQEVSA